MFHAVFPPSNTGTGDLWLIVRKALTASGKGVAAKQHRKNKSFILIESATSHFHCALYFWNGLFHKSILSPPFRELNTEKPLEGGRKEKRKREREGERERTWQTPYTLHPDMFTSYAVDIQSRSNCGKDDATSDVTTLGLQPKNFHSIRGGWPDFSFGQTLRLFHAEFSIANSVVLRTVIHSWLHCHVHCTLIFQP